MFLLSFQHIILVLGLIELVSQTADLPYLIRVIWVMHHRFGYQAHIVNQLSQSA